jgi:hypothetical protein
MKLHLGVFFEPTLILPSCAFEIVRDGVKRAVGKCCDDVVHEAEKFDVRLPRPPMRAIPSYLCILK